jgi:hypothetical protein
MSISNTTFYSLNDFNNILFDDFQYKLSNEVYDIIKNLTTKLGISTEKEREKEKKQDYPKPRNKRNSAYTNETKVDETWTQLRSFKSTLVEKKTEGVEKIMNDIRSCLNKISTKNYESKKDEIIEYINTLFLNPVEESAESHMSRNKEIEKIANNIFEIASTNKFFSELYAQLYKSLIERFEIFKDILNLFIENFTDTMYKIDYVSPNEDYDKFCEYNKLNDMRKATSVFIVNLVKNEAVDPMFLLKICIKTISIVTEYIDQPNRVNEVEEITENIFLLVSQSHSHLKSMVEWNDVIENISVLSQMKAKDKASLSSRSIFKYMDIMDKINATK